MEEYPFWEIYTKRLIDAGLEKEAAREVVDLIVQTAIDQKGLDAALERHSQDLSKELSAATQILDSQIDARINAASNKMILWVIGSLVSVSIVMLSAAKLLFG
ncbi:hypothetical protein WH95_19515 [Kiloniella litopenaei]|uniref:Uncharacterized protein n=1 Tax=Kiloniella litopenaei TaxID=1549748 RepID=A0A0M2R5F8_9PROT|nr:hypothetical protein [Kiloniella litopenaei]KKJ75210.1 hypothetical protein WH95_19515 [Kiloniella litopenaei]